MFTFTDPAADNKDLMRHMVERYGQGLGDYLGETRSTGTAEGQQQQTWPESTAQEGLLQQHVWRLVQCCCHLPSVVLGHHVTAGCLSLLSRPTHIYLTPWSAAMFSQVLPLSPCQCGGVCVALCPATVNVWCLWWTGCCLWGTVQPTGTEGGRAA